MSVCVLYCLCVSWFAYAYVYGLCSLVFVVVGVVLFELFGLFVCICCFCRVVSCRVVLCVVALLISLLWCGCVVLCALIVFIYVRFCCWFGSGVGDCCVLLCCLCVWIGVVWFWVSFPCWCLVLGCMCGVFCFMLCVRVVCWCVLFVLALVWLGVFMCDGVFCCVWCWCRVSLCCYCTISVVLLSLRLYFLFCAVACCFVLFGLLWCVYWVWWVWALVWFGCIVIVGLACVFCV